VSSILVVLRDSERICGASCEGRSSSDFSLETTILYSMQVFACVPLVLFFRPACLLVVLRLSGSIAVLVVVLVSFQSRLIVYFVSFRFAFLLNFDFAIISVAGLDMPRTCGKTWHRDGPARSNTPHNPLPSEGGSGSDGRIPQRWFGRCEC